MNIILTGQNGMLGHDLKKAFEEKGHTVFGFSKKKADITKLNVLKKAIASLGDTPIDFWVNASAYTKVDQAETDFEQARLVNAYGVSNIIKVATELDVPLVHFSTDYIYDGQKKEAYTEHDPSNPINKYGQSKLEGEAFLENYPNHYLFRVQWLFGEHGPNFVKTIQRLIQTKESLSIVVDQWGSPTWTGDLARCVVSFLETKQPFGSYNLRSLGETTWCDFAKEIVELSDSPCQIHPIESKDYPVSATRPLNGRLNIEKYLGLSCQKPLPWKQGLAEMMSHLAL